MNSITWKYVKPLANKSVVKEFLKENNVLIPDYIVELVEKYNGGRPSEKTIITDKSREYVFKSLLSYNVEDKETIYGIYEYVFKNTNYYPLGSDAAGNFVCFDTIKKCLVLWKHETDSVEKIVNVEFM